MENWATATELIAAAKPAEGAAITFVATVDNLIAENKIPAGAVQFLLFGERHGEPVKLNKAGRAVWSPKDVDPKKYLVSAVYLPAQGTSHLGSTSATLEPTQK